MKPLADSLDNIINKMVTETLMEAIETGDKELDSILQNLILGYIEDASNRLASWMKEKGLYEKLEELGKNPKQIINQITEAARERKIPILNRMGNQLRQFTEQLITA